VSAPPAAFCRVCALPPHSTPRATSMNPKHVHTPVSTRARCPVCHQHVYSRAGIHPQCAMRQADPPKPKGEVPAVPVEDK
jgi:hypothetical protein